MPSSHLTSIMPDDTEVRADQEPRKALAMSQPRPITPKSTGSQYYAPNCTEETRLDIAQCSQMKPSSPQVARLLLSPRLLLESSTV